MKKLCIFTMIAVLFGSPFAAATGSDYRQDRRQDNRQLDRTIDRKIDRHLDKKYIGRPISRPVHRREFRGIVVIRPYGHFYHGYGHFRHDNDAYKWLAFTAITLKILDNLNEQAQREHEAAQIKATSAPVGQEIVWNSNGASGNVIATREGTNNEGLTCREYQQTITIGDQSEKAYGTACLQADGAWKIIS